MQILDDIRRVEDEGEKLIAKAKQDSDELIRLTREEARKLIDDVKEECLQAEARLIAEAEIEAQGRIHKAREEDTKVLAALRASAQENMEHAVKLIIVSISGNSEWP